MECNDLICNIVIGLVTGFISGFVVYKLTTKREKRNQAYNFIKHFLFNNLSKSGMYFPTDLFDNLDYFRKESPELEKAIFEVIDVLHPENTEDTEMTDKEIEISEKILKAWAELSKVKKL